MKYIKTKEQHIKENYFSDLGDKLQDAKDDVVRDINQGISDKATGRVSKAIIGASAKMGGFPQAELEKFISYIQSSCEGEVITIDKIKELVSPMLRFGVGLSADRARGTAIPTENINFVDIVSELIYAEMEKRGMLDCTDSDMGEDFDTDEEEHNL